MKTHARISLTLGSLLLALSAGALAAAEPAAPTAKEARLDLLDLLVQNGLITRDQADAVAAKESAAAAASASTPTVRPLAKTISKLSIGGRVQAQFANLAGETDTAAGDPAATSHFLLRRVYLMTKAEFTPDWRLSLTYNFSNDLFDLATIQWGQPGDLTVDIGWRMVNLGYEQRMASGTLKAIERSAATRYFAESNNGARLGAASYRVGVFADGTAGAAFWGAAITNPEQPTTLAMAAGSGSAANNTPAFWLNGGFKLKGADSSLTFGTGLGWLPDQGGRTLGAGGDLAAGSLDADYTAGRFNLLAEVLAADNPRGALDGDDAFILGGYVQPSWRFTEKLEGVARIGFLDTDGRGVSLRDAIPYSPVATLTDRVQDYYLGATWYFRGHDLKVQAGLIYARGEDTPAGAPATTETYGLRSQLQMNF